MNTSSNAKIIQDQIESAREHITTIDWNNPTITAPIKQFTEMAIQLVHEGKIGFDSLAGQKFEPEVIDALNTVAMNDYFIQMHFWQTVAFVLEAKVRGLEAIMSGKDISSLFKKN
jgi:hypothetical protein